jgi:hypothetical protein
MNTTMQTERLIIPPDGRAARTCSFCNFTASYDDFPEGSVCFLGICACAPCLETDKTKEFRELLEVG